MTTLEKVAQLTEQLLKQHHEILSSHTGVLEDALANIKKRNAITAALSELSAVLSYSMTQGTSGCAPILSNPSPFPHFSLLGIGGTVRALTKFTRYLEAAFAARDAAEVITKEYANRKIEVPTSISLYTSGDEYKLLLQPNSDKSPSEEFDRGGVLIKEDNMPMIVYLSTRHGFKETKFTVTAAAEMLTSEVVPKWTTMTLSHEIMHNRVRQIFQSLFGMNWDQDRISVLSEDHYTDFKEYYESRKDNKLHYIDSAIRNAVLYFCCAMERAMEVKAERRNVDQREISLQSLEEYYRRHKMQAIELFVHFHDYYFSYAFQAHLYAVSLWASWITVAAPYARPTEYLVRTLATLACGTGYQPNAAFDYAKEILEDALTRLEMSRGSFPLFAELRRLMNDEKTRAFFKPSYFLIDQVRRFFASSVIASRIDRIADDPFSEGSTSADDYSAIVFIYGEENSSSFISPVRFSVASLLRSMKGTSPIKDEQWLTA